jgi:hypothetical protein
MSAITEFTQVSNVAGILPSSGEHARFHPRLALQLPSGCRA